MARADVRTRGFWIAVAIVVALGVLAWVGLHWRHELPRGAGRVAVTWASSVLLIAAGVGVALLAMIALSRPHDERHNWKPVGDRPVWLALPGDGAAARWIAKAGSFTIGSAPDDDCVLAGTDAHHARVRVFPWMTDVGRLGRGRVRVDGRALGRGEWRACEDGAVLELDGVRVRLHVDWLPDDDDPHVGTRAAGELLLRRRGATPWGTRYRTARAIVDRCDRRPLTDDELAAYEKATADARTHCAAIARVETARDVDGTPVLSWPAERGGYGDRDRDRTDDRSAAAARLEADDVHALAVALAPLHARGQAHGALTPAHVLRARPARGGVALAIPRGVSAAEPAPPYRTPGRAPDDAAADADELTEDDFLAPELRAGGAPTPQGDVYALATWLERAVSHSRHVLAARDWLVLIHAARAGSPSARPADAAAFADAILRVAARTAGPHDSFAGKTFADCPSCGEHLLALDPEDRTMMDARGSGGRMMGGQHLRQRIRCLGCGHDASKDERIAY